MLNTIGLHLQTIKTKTPTIAVGVDWGKKDTHSYLFVATQALA